MPVPPDPASVLWEDAAAVFLGRVIAARGQWYAARIADPTRAQAAYFAQIGYDPFGPDDKSGRGALNARDAWRRAFLRAVWRANDPRGGGPGRTLQLEVGRKMPRRGVIPPGRPVRGRTRPGGQRAAQAVARLPEALRWAHGGGAASDTSRRDWVTENPP